MNGPHVPERTCSWTDCSERGDFHCSRCLAAYYCSADHQHKDWPKHKQVCASMGPGVPSSRVAASLAVRVENTERLEREKRSWDIEVSGPMASSWAAIMAASEKRTELREQMIERNGILERANALNAQTNALINERARAQNARIRV